MFLFTIPCDQSDGDFRSSKTEGVVSSSMHLMDDEEDQISIRTNEIACGVIHERTSESPGDALSWEGGIESSSKEFGSFLGRFGSMNPKVQKVIRMLTEASSVTIRFKCMILLSFVTTPFFNVEKSFSPFSDACLWLLVPPLDAIQPLPDECSSLLLYHTLYLILCASRRKSRYHISCAVLRTRFQKL